MKNMNLLAVAVTVAFGGCTVPKVQGTPMVAPDTIFEAPMVTLTAKGATLRKVNEPAYCRGEVAGLYGTLPQYVKVNPAVRHAYGFTTITGEVDHGSEGIKMFVCRYNANGAFMGVTTQESN